MSRSEICSKNYRKRQLKTSLNLFFFDFKQKNENGIFWNCNYGYWFFNQRYKTSRLRLPMNITISELTMFQTYLSWNLILRENSYNIPSQHIVKKNTYWHVPQKKMKFEEQSRGRGQGPTSQKEFPPFRYQAKNKHFWEINICVSKLYKLTVQTYVVIWCIRYRDDYLIRFI